jgi:hypothetical protein
MKIISGCNNIRYNKTIENHNLYASYYNYDYKFYHCPNHKTPYFIKIEKILESFEKHNQVLWMDDDAFFCDINWQAMSIFDITNKDMIVAESPRRNEGKTPLFNSGVMFFKKTTATIQLLKEVLEIGAIRNNNNFQWNSLWGAVVGGDQDTLIYLTQTKYNDIIEILDQKKINARPCDFSKKSIYPIVHFAGVKNRNISINNFEYIL